MRDGKTEGAIEAAKNFAKFDIALLKVEIECGFYKKPIEAIAKEIRYDPLPEEIRTVIMPAWTRGGLLPPTAIETMLPVAEPETTK